MTGYFWYYGDSVVLSFDIYGEFTSDTSNSYMGIEDVLNQCNATLTIYNFRHNIISQRTIPANTTVEFSIDGELSKKMVKDKYTMSLVITNEDTLYSETVFSTNDCVFEVR